MVTENPSTPPQSDPGNSQDQKWKRQSASATELPFVLVLAMLVGGGFGYLLDHWLHTRPWMMIVFGVVGFGTGIRDVLRRVGK